MSIDLMTLPYEMNALEPHMSARTVEFHYGKHHRGYVDKTVAAIKGTPLEGENLETIVAEARKAKNASLFDNSAQIWNHNAFWRSMAPRGGGAPPDGLAKMIDRDFGSLDQFKAAFKAEATGHFGSGWTWLVLKGDKLAVTSYHDADTPLGLDGLIPLLTADVWEHAYYLDYQNARPKFVETFLDNLVDWTGVARLLKL